MTIGLRTGSCFDCLERYASKARAGRKLNDALGNARIELSVFVASCRRGAGAASRRNLLFWLVGRPCGCACVSLCTCVCVSVRLSVCTRPKVLMLNDCSCQRAAAQLRKCRSERGLVSRGQFAHLPNWPTEINVPAHQLPARVPYAARGKALGTRWRDLQSGRTHTTTEREGSSISAHLERTQPAECGLAQQLRVHPGPN